MRCTHLDNSTRIHNARRCRMLCFFVITLFCCELRPSLSFQTAMTMSLRSRNAPSASIAESTSAPSQVSPRISRTSAPVSSARPSIQTVPTRKRKHGSNAGVTSTLISQLAVVALKRRLAQQTAVNCNVSGSSSDLLMRGEVGPVTVAGRRWRSPLGLTCRAIEAKVQTCQLDMGAVISRRKLILTVPGG